MVLKLLSTIAVDGTCLVPPLCLCVFTVDKTYVEKCESLLPTQ